MSVVSEILKKVRNTKKGPVVTSAKAKLELTDLLVRRSATLSRRELTIPWRITAALLSLRQ